MKNKMKIAPFVIGLMFCLVAYTGISADENQLFAQYPPTPTGCCKVRDWLAGNWRQTDLSFTECERLNRNRDSLDDLFEEKGYVWWDANCQN
jgi:hypothetical protein